MKLSKIPGLGRFGTFIDGVDFNTITNEEWMEIGSIQMKGLVTILRNVNCTKDQYVERMLQFGSTRYGLKNYLIKKYHLEWGVLIQLALDKSDILSKRDCTAIRALIKTQEKTEAGYDVTRISGGYDAEGDPKGLFAEGELLWHCNEAGTLTFTPGVSLLGAKNMIGSATGFLTTPDYYESVSERFRSELDEMILVHDFMPGKVNPGLNADQDALINVNMCPEGENEIPMVIRSPGEIIGLHYSINTVTRIKGMTKRESDQVFAEINKELFTEKYIYDHWYKQNNDLLLFENSITLHRRLGNIDGRLAYRFAHDYTHLQHKPYMPYLLPEFIKRYTREIHSFVKVTGNEDFKLPQRSWLDYIPVVRDLV